MRKFESSQKDESRAQLADSSKLKPIKNVELFSFYCPSQKV